MFSKNSIFKDRVILVLLLMLTIFWIYYGGSIPFLDGTYNFLFQLMVLNGGLEQLTNAFYAGHPPLNYLVGALFMKIFGIHEYATNAQGYFYFVGAISSIYLICKKYGGVRYARIAAFILVFDPIFVANSIFSMTDYMVGSFVLMSFAAYSYDKKFLWWLFLSLAIMSKETAILLPIIFILYWFFCLPFFTKEKIKADILKLIIPIIVLCENYIWIQYANSIGRVPWNYFSDEEFSRNIIAAGIFRALLKYIFSGGIFNEQAAANCLHLFVLNFQWIATIATIIGGAVVSYKKIKSIDRVNIIALLETPFLIMALFFLVYCIVSLMLPTWAVTRYVIPASILMIFPLAYVVDQLIEAFDKFKIIIYGVGLTFLIIRLFYSFDPISTKIWGRELIGKERFYDVRLEIDGIDSIAYNIQFLELVRRHTEETKRADKDNMPIISRDCYWANLGRTYFPEAIFGYHHLKTYCIRDITFYDDTVHYSLLLLYGARSIAIDNENNIIITNAVEYATLSNALAIEYTNVHRYALDGVYRDTVGGWAKAVGTTKSAGQFYYPTSVVVDEQNNIYVADSFNRRIQKFSPEGKFQSFFDGVGNFAPISMSFDNANHIYMIDDKNYIYKFNMDGKILHTWEVINTNNIKPVSVSGVAATDRNVFVGDINNHEIISFNTDREMKGSWALPDGFVSDDDNVKKYLHISWDKDSCILYVTSINSSKILAFNTSGVLIQTINTSGAIVGITGLAFSKDKELYAIGINKIREFRVDKVSNRNQCNLLP